ncbi:zinc finger family protein [Striga asiatica]|uniref:Zinc finger family protein n=1 Tax=Striga asiatica TaxID=4170 RepID=A0A5A7QUK2_STRAF|nr:zinc finger family protein [Striga asiatica]
MADPSTYDFFKLNVRHLKPYPSSNSSASVDPRLFFTSQALGGHQNTYERERAATRRSLTADNGFAGNPSATAFEIDGPIKLADLKLSFHQHVESLIENKIFISTRSEDDDRGDGSVDDLVEGVGLDGEWVGVERDVLGGEAVGRGVAAGLVADVLTCRAAAVDLGGFCVRREKGPSVNKREEG